MQQATIQTRAGLLGLSFLLFPFTVLAGPVDSHMQYSGAATIEAETEQSVIISKTAITILTVTASNNDNMPATLTTDAVSDDDWATPLPFLDDLISFELGHNFELRPTTHKSPKKHLTPDLPTATVGAPTTLNEFEASIYSMIENFQPTPTPTDGPMLYDRNVGTVGDNDARACSKASGGYDYFKRGHTYIGPPSPDAPRASHHAYSSALLDAIAPYMSVNAAVNSHNAARRRGLLDLPPQDPNAPYGARYSTGGYAVYTDKVAFDNAVKTWATNNHVLRGCWPTPPVFYATTVTPSPKSDGKFLSKLTSKRLSNANANGRFEAPKGADLTAI